MKKKQKPKRTILLVAFLTSLLLFYWLWLLYVTQIAVDTNTYVCSEKITEVKIDFAYHRGTDKLYITTNNHYYMLDTGWRSQNKSYKLSEKILSSTQNCTLTVWEHFPKYLFDLNKPELQLHQIVDLRNDKEIYWDITNHNSFQRRERTFGIFGGIFLSIIAISLDILIICLHKSAIRGWFYCVVKNVWSTIVSWFGRRK